MEVYTNLDGLALYEALLVRQQTPYNAYIANDTIKLLSFSPELFFKIELPKTVSTTNSQNLECRKNSFAGCRIVTKPMKGTAPCVGDGHDEERATFLTTDPKNRAENIMIVDLLRNDLGMIAKTGTVQVDKLFAVEKHPTVLQMTSEISATLADQITLYDILLALFPCGSITGAPKASTMRVIDELEPYNRQLYCGAIGFLSPTDCEFSVPIRILYGKNYHYSYHAGGAIVWDSDPEDEWLETKVKASFLQTKYDLIETAVDDWERHVARMQRSAYALGFKWNEEIANIAVHDVTRVVLHQDGTYELQYKQLPNNPKRTIRLGRHVNSSNIFLGHKISIRDHGDDEFFEEIRMNERGEITEGMFTNIAVELEQQLYTPPLSCGLLNGTYRQKLLADGVLKEKVLTEADLHQATKIYCFNSVRKMIEVTLC